MIATENNNELVTTIGVFNIRWGVEFFFFWTFQWTHYGEYKISMSSFESSLIKCRPHVSVCYTRQLNSQITERFSVLLNEIKILPLNPLVTDPLYLVCMANFFILTKEGIIENFSYELRAYESVYDRSHS